MSDQVHLSAPGALRSRVLRLTLVLAALLAAVMVSSPAQAATYQITNYDNDGTQGVYLRNSGDVNNVTRDSAHYVTYGTSVNLVCGLSGSAVGSKSNTAWDYVQVIGGPNAGRYGYISEHWVNTPVGPNQHVSGEPACGAAPAPAGPSATAQRAIDWARSHNGQNFDSGYCLLFVQQAYSAAGVSLGTGGTAARYWSSNPRGFARHTDRSPEVGSLVFWGATAGNSAGHVGIYLGNDTVISTSSWPQPSPGKLVHTWSFSGRNARGYPYLGWMHIA
jgi:cell wall-associated NlpC family hydrolase